MTPDVEALAQQVDRFASLLRKEYPRWRVEFHRSIDSTSSELRRRVEARAISTPTLLVAAHQDAGKGRQGRTWSSNPGAGLLFTASLPIGEIGLRRSGLGVCADGYPLTLMPLQLGLAIGLRLRLFGWRAHLKWPNDIIVGECKVAGILTESVDGWLLAGVGINLLQGPEAVMEAPAPGVQFPPGSLASLPRDAREEFHPYDLTATLLQSVIAVLESPWNQERMLGWYKRWCVTLGQRVSRLEGGVEIRGLAKDIAADGSLVVETAPGQSTRVANDVLIETGGGAL